MRPPARVGIRGGKTGSGCTAQRTFSPKPYHYRGKALRMIIYIDIYSFGALTLRPKSSSDQAAYSSFCTTLSRITPSPASHRTERRNTVVTASLRQIHTISKRRFTIKIATRSKQLAGFMSLPKIAKLAFARPISTSIVAVGSHHCCRVV